MANIKKLSAKNFFPMLSARQERFEKANSDLKPVSDQATVIAKAFTPKDSTLKLQKSRNAVQTARALLLFPILIKEQLLLLGSVQVNTLQFLKQLKVCL